MARAGLCLAILLAGCGLASKDFEVSKDFTAGGGPPQFIPPFDSSAFTSPISSDLNRISSIKLTAARIEATDNNGDLTFIGDAIIGVGQSQNILPAAVLASMTSPPPTGATSIQLTVTGKELKPYFQATSTISASIHYSPVPTTARGLRLVLTIHGSLL